MTATGLAVAAVLFMAICEAPLFAVLAALTAVLRYGADGDLMAMQTIFIEMYRLAGMPVLVALPLFTLAGCMLNATAAPRRMTDLLQALFGWLPGGVGVAAVGACALFTALTGASGVTILALGGVLYPILRYERRYPKDFTLGLLTTGGSLGLLFAPSLPLILYAVVAQVDIGLVFHAAVVPGVLLMAVLAAYCVVRRKGVERPSQGRPAIGAALRHSAWDWPILGIILLGVYGGLTTVAEVSVLVVTYIFVVECLVLGEIHWRRQLPAIMVESAMLSGAIIVILATALALTGYLVEAQVPQRILALLTGLTESRVLFLAGLNLFLIAVGCMMDIFSAIVVVVPIMIPVALSYGIDPIHLGIIFLVNLEIGYATPPVGINLFIASLKFNVPITRLYRASLPFLALMLVVLALITYLPGLSLWAIR